MADGRLKGINLLTEVNLDSDKIVARYNQSEVFSIPFNKVSNTAVYNGNEVEVDIPFEEFNEQQDVFCAIRFFIPGKGETAEENAEETAEINMAQSVYETIRKKSKVEENLGDLICTLPDLPLVVPRGKYTADLYRDNSKTKGELKLHGSTFSYKVNFKNIVKAFLLPQNDDSNMNLVLGFDKPLRQGNTSYLYIIFQFKRNKEASIDLKLPAEQLKEIHPELEPSYQGNYFEVAAKLFKLIIGINIIIPAEFKTFGGHAGLKCHINNQEGLLFPLNKSLIFIKKPVVYIRLDDIQAVDFYRVSGGHGVRGFDFEVRRKNGNTTKFSGADKRELDSIMGYFEKNKVPVKTADENANLDQNLGEMSDEEDRIGMNDGEEEEGDEEMDGDFVAPDEDDEEDEDGDYDADGK